MKYRVHAFVEIRVPLIIEAESMKEAVRIASETNFHAMLDRGEIEFAEDIHHFLVDEVGDENYEKSQWFDGNGKKEPDSPGVTPPGLK